MSWDRKTSSSRHRGKKARGRTSRHTSDTSLRVTMDFIIHRPLAAIQHRLSWVSTSPINWQGLVQSFSWAVCAFESYLMYVAVARNKLHVSG
jgi:hypothetical protein